MCENLFDYFVLFDDIYNLQPGFRIVLFQGCGVRSQEMCTSGLRKASAEKLRQQPRPFFIEHPRLHAPYHGLVEMEDRRGAAAFRSFLFVHTITRIRQNPCLKFVSIIARIQTLEENVHMREMPPRRAASLADYEWFPCP